MTWNLCRRRVVVVSSTPVSSFVHYFSSYVRNCLTILLICFAQNVFSAFLFSRYVHGNVVPNLSSLLLLQQKTCFGDGFAMFTERSFQTCHFYSDSVFTQKYFFVNVSLCSRKGRSKLVIVTNFPYPYRHPYTSIPPDLSPQVALDHRFWPSIHIHTHPYRSIFF